MRLTRRDFFISTAAAAVAPLAAKACIDGAGDTVRSYEGSASLCKWTVYPAFMRGIVEGRVDMRRVTELSFSMDPFRIWAATVVRDVRWDDESMTLFMPGRDLQWTMRRDFTPSRVIGHWGRLPFVYCDLDVGQITSGNTLTIMNSADDQLLKII